MSDWVRGPRDHSLLLLAVLSVKPYAAPVRTGRLVNSFGLNFTKFSDLINRDQDDDE